MVSTHGAPARVVAGQRPFWPPGPCQGALCGGQCAHDRLACGRKPVVFTGSPVGAVCRLAHPDVACGDAVGPKSRHALVRQPGLHSHNPLLRCAQCVLFTRPPLGDLSCFFGAVVAHVVVLFTTPLVVRLFGGRVATYHCVLCYGQPCHIAGRAVGGVPGLRCGLVAACDVLVPAPAGHSLI